MSCYHPYTLHTTRLRQATAVVVVVVVVVVAVVAVVPAVVVVVIAVLTWHHPKPSTAMDLLRIIRSYVDQTLGVEIHL